MLHYPLKLLFQSFYRKASRLLPRQKTPGHRAWNDFVINFQHQMHKLFELQQRFVPLIQKTELSVMACSNTNRMMTFIFWCVFNTLQNLQGWGISVREDAKILDTTFTVCLFSDTKNWTRVSEEARRWSSLLFFTISLMA